MTTKKKDRKRKKAGSAPGTLQHVGEKRNEVARIIVTEYNADELSERELHSGQIVMPPADSGTVTWYHIYGVHDETLIGQIGQIFNIHGLVLEDILDTMSRSKYENYGSYLFFILKMVQPDSILSHVQTENISIIVGPHYLLSFQEGEHDIFQPIRERLNAKKSTMRTFGPDYLAYTLLDLIIDHYLTVIDRLDERIDEIDEQLLMEVTPQTLPALYQVKKRAMVLQNIFSPHKNVITELLRDETDLFSKQFELYLRDVNDHINQINESIIHVRETVMVMLDIYLSLVSNKMNNVMKFLTIIATIFIPLTFLAGIYGMNFKYMPELDWPWSYPLLLLVMVTTALVMLAYFRRKGWL
ncbi:magnesium/cobalt transporter CorA [bacterium]|nr:magnesium/cobalt transporter CorA [bacterium]